ncbi:OmpA family protein [Blastococcus sp. TF02A-30]|uniref:OmpA family protein n=1 Tax=Blastococcus sp. TF02A-30 TaxID=2250580 RepID=UPI001313F6AB|nr:OmpA family protein [Blastococcus sp. TF02A-30]
MVPALLVAGLSGCGGDATADTTVPRDVAGGALAVVVGAHAAAPAADLTGPAAAARDQAVSQQSAFSVVVADGAPYVAASGVLAVSGDDATEQRAGNRQQLEEAVTAARPRTPETDLLGALRVAADSIRQEPGHRRILVLDPGLSTAGALDFRRADLLDAVPQEVADALGKTDQLPNLSGLSVQFVGLGVTAEPQPALTPIRRAQLQELWTTIATTAGATHVAAEPGAGDGPPAGDLPPVSSVAVPPGYSCTGTTMTITGGELAFHHDTDSWFDPETAERILKPIADQMLAGQLSAVLRGTTAALRDPAEQMMLSYLQAQAVANLWLEFKVPQQQLTVVGLGSEFPGRIEERTATGDLDPIAAAANRTITITFSAPVTC